MVSDDHQLSREAVDRTQLRINVRAKLSSAIDEAPLTIRLRLARLFFVASSAASAAYLTVSEIFPLQFRAFAIAIFYSLGTLVGGVGAPILFGCLVATNSRVNVALGYGVGAVLMLAGAVCERLIGVEAAGKSLESISKPLQSA